MAIGKISNYTVHLSDKPAKKYYALVGARKVYFGDTSYEHYHDRFGHYKHLDHKDPKRRKNFKIRHEKNRHLPGTAAWFADQVLW